MSPGLRTAALLLLVGVAGANGALPDEAGARRRGLAALPSVLAHVASPDADLRLRAQRLAKLLVHDFLVAHRPKDMVLIPARVEVSVRGVRVVGGLYLGRHEVTRATWRQFARGRDWKREEWDEGEPQWPIAAVTLREARAFAKAHDARLPTREEFELAATAGLRFRYPWGDTHSPARANTRELGVGHPEAVGHRPRGCSLHGAADLLGNVAEWTETPTRPLRRDRPAPRSRSYYVVGGSYRDPVARPHTRRFLTHRLDEAHWLPDVGFRLAKSLPPIKTP